jgi:hypothetical protein
MSVEQHDDEARLRGRTPDHVGPLGDGTPLMVLLVEAVAGSKERRKRAGKALMAGGAIAFVLVAWLGGHGELARQLVCPAVAVGFIGLVVWYRTI